MSTPIPNPIREAASRLNIDSMDAAQIEELTSSESLDKAEVDGGAVRSRRAFASDTTASAAEDIEMTDLRMRAAMSSRADQPVLAQPDAGQAAARQLARDQQLYSNPNQLGRVYNQEFQRAFDARLASQPLTAAQQAWVIYKKNNPQAAIDPELQPLIDDLSSQALAAVWKAQENVGLDPNWIPPENTADGYVLVSYSVFASALHMKGDNRTPPYTKEEINSMQYAYFHPESASPEALALLQREGIKEQAEKLLKESGLELPPGVSPDSTSYDHQMADIYHANYDQALQAYVEKNNLSKNQQAKLEYQHYNPTAAYEDRSELARINAALEGEALAKVIQDYSLPKEWTPIKNSVSDQDYGAVFQGEWQYTNETLLDEYIKNHFSALSPEAQQLRRAMTDPNVETADYPQDIKNIVKNLKIAAAQKVRIHHNLPTNWEPAVAPIVVGNRLGVELNKLMDETVRTAKAVMLEVAPSLSSSPHIADFFAMIGDAISAAQQCSFAQQMSDSTTHQKVISSKTETRKTQLDEQVEKAKEYAVKQADYDADVAEAQSKAERGLGIAIGMFVVAVVVLVSAVSAAVTAGTSLALLGVIGPLIGAVVAGLFMGSAIQQVNSPDHTGFMDSVIKAISDMPLWGKIVIGIVILAVVIIVPYLLARAAQGVATQIVTASINIAQTTAAMVIETLPILAGPIFGDLFKEMIGGGDDPATQISAGVITALFCMLLTFGKGAKAQTSVFKMADKGFQIVEGGLQKAIAVVNDIEKQLKGAMGLTLKGVGATALLGLTKLIKLLMQILLVVATQCNTMEGFTRTSLKAYNDTLAITGSLCEARQHTLKAEMVIFKGFADKDDAMYTQLTSQLSQLADAIMELQSSNAKTIREISDIFSNMIKGYSREIGRLENAI